MKFKILRYHFLIASVACLVLIVAGFVTPKFLDWKYNITLIGSILYSIYLVENHKIEQTRLFKELFTEFNKRYDGLNEGLNTIIAEDQEKELSRDQIDLLYNYFNLCGEEYLFYKQGFIYPEVWKAWCNGMKIFTKDKRIRDLWEKEAQTDSYYGLNF